MSVLRPVRLLRWAKVEVRENFVIHLEYDEAREAEFVRQTCFNGEM